MTLTRAKSRKESGGFVLYGNRPDNGKWLERWYPTEEKARAFAEKRSWPVEISDN